MMAESKGNPLALRPEYLNPGGGKDGGLFQINSKFHLEVWEAGNIYDPEYNIISASLIFEERSWSEWSTSKIPGVIDDSVSPTNQQSQPVKKTKIVFNDSFDFSVNEDKFDFFLKRKHLNIYKYGRNQ